MNFKIIFEKGRFLFKIVQISTGNEGLSAKGQGRGRIRWM